MQMTPVSVLIITHDEESNLPGCLDSIAGWTNDIWVVDSYSEDKTVEIARSRGVNVVQHAWEGYARQKNWALTNLAMQNDWVLLLDADERVPTELANEITQVVAVDGNGNAGFWMRYRLIFYGKWIRHCGWYPTWILRLAKRGHIHFEDRAVDEHPVIDGPVGRLENDLRHESLRDFEFWIAKHNLYSTHNARIYQQLKARKTSDGIKPRFFGTQAERKRFIKERIYSRLPGRSVAMFVYMYFFRLGFLDGKHGLIFCTMHAIFQYFNVVKLWELENYKAGAPPGTIRSAPLSRSQNV